MTDRCEVCHLNFPLEGTVCVPCQDGQQHSHQGQSESRPFGARVHLPEEKNYTQAQAQAQAQVKDQAQALSSSRPPEPGCNDDGPELRRLMEVHREGRLEPVNVQLGELPPHAGVVMRNIADHMRTLMGLRRAVGDDRPLPYARSMATRAGLAKDVGTASNAINALVRAGVIEHVGSLPPLRPGIDGTKLYAPPANVVHLADRRAA